MQRLRIDITLLALVLGGVVLSLTFSREALAAGIRRALYPGDAISVASVTTTGNVTVPTSKSICLDVGCVSNIMDNSGQVVIDARTGGVRTPDDFRTGGALTVDGASNFTGALRVSYTNSLGTPGNCTINKPAGCCAIPAADNDIVVTNSLVLANAIIGVWFAQEPLDATCTAVGFLPGNSAGSFTISANAACTDNTGVCWVVFNTQ